MIMVTEGGCGKHAKYSRRVVKCMQLRETMNAEASDSPPQRQRVFLSFVTAVGMHLAFEIHREFAKESQHGAS